MEGVIEQARKLKNDAMDARDEARFEEAHKKLREAETALMKALAEQRLVHKGEQVGDFEREIAKQLVHIRGSIGGVWRRDGHHAESAAESAKAYVKSAQAYDSGYELERTESGYGIVDSYTLVQRLVVRIFVDPAAADDEQVIVEHLAVRPEIEKAKDIIRDQIYGKRVRERDEFAHADLTLVLLLLGDRDWHAQLRRFRDLRPKPAYALAAIREVVEELQKLAVNSSRASQRLREDLANALTGLQ
jgi:hypothetical protein